MGLLGTLTYIPDWTACLRTEACKTSPEVTYLICYGATFVLILQLGQ